MAPSDRRSDAELVHAARLGDRDSFAELVTRHWAMASALASRLLGSGDLARDAVQEATVTAMTGLDRLRSPDRFSAWFCGITLNVGRRWLRQRPTGPLTSSAERACDRPGPQEHAEIAELAAAVRAAVAGLAPGQREAVVLFYLQGLTHREVAAELAISVGAVKARLHQARAALAPSLTPLIDPEQMDPEKIDTEQEPDMSVTQQYRPWVDVTVAEVRRGTADDPTRRAHVMVLEEQGGRRRLPVWIGPAEAAALAVSVESQETPRPLAYQMAASLLGAAGARVTEVRITRLAATVFYATIVVDAPTGPREIDARPSDAVNLALVTGAPVRVDRDLLDDPRATEHPRWHRATRRAPPSWLPRPGMSSN